jgi:hypothetical protein
MANPDTSLGEFCDLGGGEHRVIAADGCQIADIQPAQASDYPFEIFFVLGRVGTRRIQYRAAMEMNPRNVGVVQLLGMRDVSPHEPLKAVEKANDFVRPRTGF